MRELINLVTENSESSAETPGDSVDQLTKDIKAGLIANSTINIISAYVQKQLAQAKQPIDIQPTTTPKPQNVKPQPNLPTEPVPDESETMQELQEAAAMELPSGVTLKPDELRKFLLKGGFSSEKVNDIVTFAYKDTIQKICTNLAELKQYKKEAGLMIAQMFYEVPGTLSQRNLVANALLKTGVLNLTKLTKAGRGKLNDLIAPAYASNPIVMNLKLALKNRHDFPTKVSAANKGAGEDLITILGHPVNKLSPGDLNINGKEIEIKAMGARLKGFGGTTVYGDATRIYPEWTTKISTALGADGLRVLTDAGTSLKKYFNFNLKNLQALSDAVKVSRVPNKGALINDAMTMLLETLYVQSNTAMRNTILRSFNRKTGVFDATEFRKNWFLFSYDYYKLTTADKNTGQTMHAIMFFNQGTEDYQIVTDKSQLEASWDDYELNSDLFTWNNPTGTAPKITLGKETREKHVKKSVVHETRYISISPMRARRT